MLGLLGIWRHRVRVGVRVRVRVRVRLRLSVSREEVSVRVKAGRQVGWSTFGLACFGLKNPVEDVRRKHMSG